MKPASRFALLLLGVCTTAVLGAQTTQPSGTSAPKPPQPERAVSAKASAAITAGIKYNPPPPPKPVGEEEEVDLRDVDKPKNEIVRLPKYTVTARKPPVLTDRELYTRDELEKLAMSRYITKLDSGLLNKWTIPGLGMSNEDRAMQMYLEDERLKNMEASRQQISFLRATGETERAEQAQTNYYDMYLRRRDDVHTDTLTRQQGK